MGMQIDPPFGGDADAGARIKAIRELLELSQLEFCELVLAVTRVRYLPSTLSKLESGKQRVSLADVDVFCRVDPQGRGRELLGWGNVYPAAAAESATPPADAPAPARGVVYDERDFEREVPPPGRARPA